MLEQSDDVQKLLLGKIPQTGAQWGRGGGGYLDRAGYWLYELYSSTLSMKTYIQINQFLEKVCHSPELKTNLFCVKHLMTLQYLLKK